MHRRWHIALIAIFAATAIGCSTKKNTVGTRRWHAFNARYNTYFNGSQAFIEGNGQLHGDAAPLPCGQAGEP